MLKEIGQPTVAADEKIAYWNSRQVHLLKVTGLKRRYDSEEVY